MQGRSKSQWQGPSNESGLSVYWAIGNQAGQQLESHDDVVDYGDDDDVVDDDDDDLNTLQRRVCVCVYLCVFMKQKHQEMVRYKVSLHFHNLR